MTNKLITEMSAKEFDAVIDAYIERETQDTGELPAPLFYETLRDIFRAEQVEGMVKLPKYILTLDSVVVGDRLVLSASPGTSLPANIREIEVDLPGVRVLVSLEPVVA
jgi:hypothetical protein